MQEKICKQETVTWKKLKKYINGRQRNGHIMKEESRIRSL